MLRVTGEAASELKALLEKLPAKMKKTGTPHETKRLIIASGYDSARERLLRILAVALAVCLVVVTVWLGSAVIKLENYRETNLVGMCNHYNITDPIQRIQREDCLAESQNSNSLVLAPSPRDRDYLTAAWTNVTLQSPRQPQQRVLRWAE